MATTIMDTSATLEPFLLEHIPLLDAWLHRQHVARWYPEPSENLRWARKPPAGGSHAIIASQGVPVGYIRWQQVDRETLDSLGLHEIPSNSVDVDLLLGEREDVGKGLGPHALAVLITRLRAEPAIPLVGLTTSVDNVHAQRAFEKAGFRIARQYDPPGFGDCYLMVLEFNREQSIQLAEA
jgi:RimJ/RimL family protein N-acetyltransferase